MDLQHYHWSRHQVSHMMAQTLWHIVVTADKMRKADAWLAHVSVHERHLQSRMSQKHAQLLQYVQTWLSLWWTSAHLQGLLAMSHSRSLQHVKSLFQDSGYVQLMLLSYRYYLSLDKEWHPLKVPLERRLVISGYWTAIWIAFDFSSLITGISRWRIPSSIFAEILLTSTWFSFSENSYVYADIPL